MRRWRSRCLREEISLHTPQLVPGSKWEVGWGVAVVEVGGQVDAMGSAVVWSWRPLDSVDAEGAVRRKEILLLSRDVGEGDEVDVFALELKLLLSTWVDLDDPEHATLASMLHRAVEEFTRLVLVERGGQEARYAVLFPCGEEGLELVVEATATEAPSLSGKRASSKVIHTAGHTEKIDATNQT